MAPNPRIFSCESHVGNFEFLDRKVNIEIYEEKLFLKKKVALVDKGKNSCGSCSNISESEVQNSNPQLVQMKYFVPKRIYAMSSEFFQCIHHEITAYHICTQHCIYKTNLSG
jgi:hypothetical protein